MTEAGVTRKVGVTPKVGVSVRPARPEDAGQWLAMRSQFWDDSPADHPPEIQAYFDAPLERWVCLVAERESGVLAGFAEVGLRSYAEGCTTSPVGYLEGIWVDPAARGTGAGRALVEAGEAWARSRGCREMASDRALLNESSGVFHGAVGFEETVRIVCYRKDLVPRDSMGEATS